MNAHNFLQHVTVASPCNARWADMAGDERARFCHLCQKQVYDLSALTAAEAGALIREKEGNLCGRFYQRADGTMLTADCPVGVAHFWHGVRNVVYAGIAAIALILVGTRARPSKTDNATTSSFSQSTSAPALLWDKVATAFKACLGIPNTPRRILIMGKIQAPPVITTPTPTNSLPASNSKVLPDAK